MKKLMLIILLSLSMCCMGVSAQSFLCTYEGGYFIGSGTTWYEYRPQQKDGVWNSFTQYSSNENYYFIDNGKCKLSIPKSKKNTIWIKIGNSDWKVKYTTINTYSYCPVFSSNIFAYQDGFFVKDGNTWQEYNPKQKASGAVDTFTQYKEDENYYCIKNSRITLAIPRKYKNDFYWLKNGAWVTLYHPSALYDAKSPNAKSGMTDNVSAESSQDNITPAQAYNTGMQYYNQRKYSDAVPWLEKAASGNYASAYYPLAVSYHSLPGDKNHEKAYWNYAKVLGHMDIYSRNDLFLTYFWLAHFRMDGVGSVSKDYESALYFFKKAKEYASGGNITTVDNNIATVRQLMSQQNVASNQSSSTRRTAQSNNTGGQVKYLDILDKYSSYDNTPKDMGTIIKSEKNVADNGNIMYKYYYDTYWEKNLHIWECIRCYGDGKCKAIHSFTAQVPCSMCRNTGNCGQCNGSGKWIWFNATNYKKNIAYDMGGTLMYLGGGAGSASNSGSQSGGGRSSGSSSHSSSTYTKCKYCGGGGGCNSCNGTGHKFNVYSGHEDSCPSCNGSGRCQICRGTGHL